MSEPFTPEASGGGEIPGLDHNFKRKNGSESNDETGNDIEIVLCNICQLTGRTAYSHDECKYVVCLICMVQVKNHACPNCRKPFFSAAEESVPALVPKHTLQSDLTDEIEAAVDFHCSQCRRLTFDGMQEHCCVCKLVFCGEPCLSPIRITSLVAEGSLICGKCSLDTYQQFAGFKIVYESFERFYPAQTAPMLCGGVCLGTYPFRELVACSECRKYICERCVVSPGSDLCPSCS